MKKKHPSLGPRANAVLFLCAVSAPNSCATKKSRSRALSHLPQRVSPERRSGAGPAVPAEQLHWIQLASQSPTRDKSACFEILIVSANLPFRTRYSLKNT